MQQEIVFEDQFEGMTPFQRYMECRRLAILDGSLVLYKFENGKLIEPHKQQRR